MSNKPHSEFLRNAQSIFGFGATVIGFCFALNGIYEFCTHEKLLQNKYVQSIEQFIKNIDDLPMGEKTGIAAPLLIFGNMIGRAAARRNQNKI